jgi:hypothetical protein
LAVSAYYPTEYIFDRGYGNYLGLCHLGEFMAHEMGLNLVRLNCYINAPGLGDVNKGPLQRLEAAAIKAVAAAPQAANGGDIPQSEGQHE